MMAFKHLHELLKEDQEPFQLQKYISDKRCQLKRVNNSRTTLQIKKRNTIQRQYVPIPSKSLLSKKRNTVTTEKSAAAKRSFCKNACFLSFRNSPDVRKSPFFDFPSSPGQKSPLRKGAVLLHVPANTYALLFEAAMRVQTHKKTKGKTQIMGAGFGILGSILKRLKNRNKNKKKEIGNNIIEDDEKCEEESNEMGVSCYCNKSRLSSVGWSESNEEKSLDLESSCSQHSEDSLEEAFAAYEKRFCSTPLSPFRFSLQRSPSRHQTPVVFSPATSPIRQIGKKQEETEGSRIVLDDEKEQCSPVSVLDAPYEVYDELECGDEEEYEDNDYYDEDYSECDGSSAIVQEAKEQLLGKLRRFEKLAELDHVELEKRMIEQTEEEEYHDDEPTALGRDSDNLDTLVLAEVLGQTNFQQSWKVPPHMERLVSDLILEETKEMIQFNYKEGMVNSICKKLNSWKEVQLHTIDMMVQFDFGSEYDSWKKSRTQSEEFAGELEVAIFRVLVDELADELCY